MNTLRIFHGKSLIDNCFRVYVLLCFYVPFLHDLLPIPGVNVADDLFFFGLLILCIIPLFRHAKKISLIVLVFPLYILMSCIVSYYSGNSLEIILLSLKNVKNIFLFLIVICLAYDQSSFVKNNMLFMLFSSIPIIIYQFVTLDNQDDITGLFGPKSTSLYSLIAITYLSVEMARKGVRRTGWYLILFIPIFLNETKISFVLMPVLFIYLLAISGQLRIWHFLFLFLSGVGVLGILNDVYLNLYGYEFSEIFSYDYLELYLLEYTSLHKDVPRFYRLAFAYDYISSGSFWDFIFGHGLGSVYVGDGGNKLGIVSSELRYTRLNEGTRIQIFQILIDYGFLGLLIFIFPLVYVCIKLSLKCSVATEFNMIAISLLLIMMFSLLYQNMFFTKQLSFLFYFYFYVCLIKVSQKKQFEFADVNRVMG